MKFRCSIPQTKRAFEIPGSRADLRVSFDLPESEVSSGLYLILMRGRLFKITLYRIEFTENALKQQVETLVEVLTTWTSIAPKAAAIRIDGRNDGISVTLSFPSSGQELFAKFLGLREELLLVDVDEETYKEV